MRGEALPAPGAAPGHGSALAARVVPDARAKSVGGRAELVRICRSAGRERSDWAEISNRVVGFFLLQAK